MLDSCSYNGPYWLDGFLSKIMSKQIKASHKYFLNSDCHSKYLAKSAVKYFAGQKLLVKRMLKLITILFG